MRFLSVCSGIEAASVAWAPLGWEAVAFSEIDPFPSAVLAHRFPDVPNLGDMTRFREWPDLAIDLVCGGTPCQAFSVAGLRKGLADPRGNLALTFLAIVDRYRPRWIIWENVPGVLSSDGGRDFAAFLGGLGLLGYGWAYRVLDAQWCRVDGFPRAVPQRRRRVFVVGYLGDWRRAAAVLFEPQSVLGDTPPRREAGEGFAGGVIKGASIGREPHNGPQYGDTIDDGSCYTLTTTEVHAVAFGGGNTSGPIDTAACLTAKGHRSDFEVETFVAISLVTATLTRGAESAGKGGYAGRRQEDDDNLVAHCLRGEGFNASEDGTGRGTPIVQTENHAVRRLTPRECERLQGFPDDHTLIPYRGKPAADGPRYKAIGNSWAVNVARWVGRRIEMVEQISRDAA